MTERPQEFPNEAHKSPKLRALAFEIKRLSHDKTEFAQIES